MLIVIGNLPGDATETRLCECFTPWVRVECVRIIREGDPDSPAALVDLPFAKPVADFVADRIGGRYHGGKRLNAWVALYGNA